MGLLALSRVASLVLQPAYGQVRVPDELKCARSKTKTAALKTVNAMAPR